MRKTFSIRSAAAAAAALLFLPAGARAQAPSNNVTHTLGGTVIFYSSASMPKNENEASKALTAFDFDKLVCQSPFPDQPSAETSPDPFTKIMSAVVSTFIMSESFRKDPAIPKIIAFCQQIELAHVPFTQTSEYGELHAASDKAYREEEKLCDAARDIAAASSKAKGKTRKPSEKTQHAAYDACIHAQADFRAKDDQIEIGHKEWKKKIAEMLDTSFNGAFPEGLSISITLGTMSLGWPEAASDVTAPATPVPDVRETTPEPSPTPQIAQPK